MVEIVDNRIEITNPGAPLIDTRRFVDAPAMRCCLTGRGYAYQRVNSVGGSRRRGAVLSSGSG